MSKTKDKRRGRRSILKGGKSWTIEW